MSPRPYRFGQEGEWVLDSGVNVGCPRGVCAAGLSTGLVGADVLDHNDKPEWNQTPMSQSIHFLGLDVHKESVALSLAPSDSTEVRHYGTLGGRLEDFATQLVEGDLCHPFSRTGFNFFQEHIVSCDDATNLTCVFADFVWRAPVLARPQQSCDRRSEAGGKAHEGGTFKLRALKYRDCDVVAWGD